MVRLIRKKVVVLLCDRFVQLFRSKRDKQIPGRIFSSKQAGGSVCFFYEYERVVVRFLAGADDAFKSVFHYSFYRKREKDEGEKSERRVNIVSINLYAMNQTRCHRRRRRRRRLRRGRRRLIIPLFSFYIAFFLLGRCAVPTFSDAQRTIQNDDVMSTAREKRKRDSIRRETVLGDKELDGSLNQGARTIEERRVSGGIGFRVFFASGDTFTQKKEMKDRKSDFAGVRADSETTNRNRTGKSRENQYK